MQQKNISNHSQPKSFPLQRLHTDDYEHLEVRQLYEDFNYLKKNDEICHFEFESNSISTDDLRRFREYEATTARIYKKAVITYVICSSTVRKLKKELKEGINTYKRRTDTCQRQDYYRCENDSKIR